MEDVEGAGQPVDGESGGNKDQHRERVDVAEGAVERAAFGAEEDDGASEESEGGEKGVDEAGEAVNH